MALLTELPVEAASQLLVAYGLELIELRPLEAGSVNSNFFMEAKTKSGESKRYFARIYEEQGESGAQFELRLNEMLAAAAIPVARPVRRTDGELSCEYSGKPFALYERLRGSVLSQAEVTPRAARAVGAALAKVHLAPLGDLEVGPSRFGFSQIEERLVRVVESGRRDLLPGVARIRELSSILEKERSSALPVGLIHGDLFRDNVLMGGPELVVVAGLLDFESASLGHFVYDLMVTVLAWCFGDSLDPFLTRSMVEGYLSERKLTAPELENLVTEGCIACVRFASTRLTDFSLRTPAGREPARDYQRFLMRHDALRDGALESALKGIL